MKKKLFLSVVFIALVLFVICLHILATNKKSTSAPVPECTSVSYNHQPSMEVTKSTTLTDTTTDSSEYEQVMYELARSEGKEDQQIIYHFAYTVSFSSNWNIPYWVAYELTDDETDGESVRVNSFSPDPEVKGTVITHKDYTNSGYDRGHMAPAADMKWSEQAMRESFYTSNICPQHHNLNNGDWKSLEELSRTLARQYGSIFIACGPVVYNNEQDAASPALRTIGSKQNIVVPDAFFKVLLRQKTDGTWTSIGFVFPNEPDTKKKPLMTYIRTVDEVEAITGIDFFYQLPDSVENITESTYTISDWSLR